MDDKPKLLWLSDSPLTCTGYATITRQVLNRLKDYGWDTECMGHNYFGQPLTPPIKFEDGEEVKFKLSGAGMEPYCKDLITPRIREKRPEVFGILLDTFMTYPWLLDLDMAPAKTFFYFPSDGGGQLPTGCERILQKVHLPI
ncbi:MAG: hypothetical protein R3321_14480, partial [Nitrososphaeraceae archaeon]|nr:hypothetical protein [Nitrososphaeraceae archaeon]